MKKEIEELRRRLAEAERRVEMLEKKDGKTEYHFHSYPPVYVPNPAPISPLVPAYPPYPIITWQSGQNMMVSSESATLIS